VPLAVGRPGSTVPGYVALVSALSSRSLSTSRFQLRRRPMEGQSGVRALDQLEAAAFRLESLRPDLLVVKR